jgi:hypothetical protein
MSAGDFGKLHDQMSVIFEGALGFAAFTNKDYPAARDHYLKSVRIDAGNLQDLYQLGLSQLQLTPIDVSGFWYLARAWNLAAKNAAAQQTIATYAKAKYVNYHGGADGWDAILENARTNSAPPTDFAVTSAH